MSSLLQNDQTKTSLLVSASLDYHFFEICCRYGIKYTLLRFSLWVARWTNASLPGHQVHPCCAAPSPISCAIATRGSTTSTIMSTYSPSPASISPLPVKSTTATRPNSQRWPIFMLVTQRLSWFYAFQLSPTFSPNYWLPVFYPPTRHHCCSFLILIRFWHPVLYTALSMFCGPIGTQDGCAISCPVGWDVGHILWVKKIQKKNIYID